MKNFLNILSICVIFLSFGAIKAIANDLDEVICNAMKGMQAQEEKKIPYCWTCKFFSISWDTSFPYSCDLMGFKSKITPCLDVVRFDGKRCLGYVEKEVHMIRMTQKFKRKRKVNFLA